MPSPEPITSEIEAAITPAWIDTRAPQITRLRMSRPNSSVPIRFLALGGSRSIRKSCLIGSYGLTNPANIAETSNTSRTAAPARPAVDLVNRRRAAAHGDRPARRPSSTTRLGDATESRGSMLFTLAIPDPWVEVGVDDVHYQ